MISVIIPTLNEEKYIEATLKALKSQDYKGKYEIIVVDAMSKDSTVKIARRHADKVILIKNKGVAIQRNAGVRIARGDILVFMDADTVPLYNLLNTIKKTFRNKKMVAASCPVMPLRYSNRELLTYWLLSEIILKSSIKFKFPIMAGACLVCRKNAFKLAGGFDEKFKLVEDIEFSRRLSKQKGKFKFMDDTIVLTSTRRLRKWGFFKQINAWPLGYFRLKLLKKLPSYRPVR